MVQTMTTPGLPSSPALLKLRELGKLSDADLGRAIAEQRRSKTSVEEILIDMGVLTDRDLLEVRAESLRVPFVSVEELSPDPAVVVLLPEQYATDRAVIPIERSSTQVVVAVSDPANVAVTDEIRGILKQRVQIVMGSRGAILKKLAEYRDHYKALAVEQLLSTVQDQGISLGRRLGLAVGELTDIAEQAPIVKAVNLLLLQGLLKRASDIHIIPTPRALQVRYRVDGQLVPGQQMPWNLAPNVVNRIKILAKLDISERRLPQDGSFHILVDNREIDLRVATTPTINGEKVVMRILDKHGILLGLESLGMGRENYLRLRRNIRRPNGIVLIVGPTGSGKTTTLYAAIQAISADSRNITTVEDPVEYHIEGITQIQVQADIGLTFAHALRSILRQDPDVILLGEIRDKDSAEIAIRASLTGHLVFATLHANDAVSAVARLLDMGSEPFLIASALRCVVGQRLVRTICRQCKEPTPMFRDISPALALKLRGLGKFFHGRGCPHCFGTGYRGRTVISEVLEVGEEVRRLMADRASSQTLARQAEVDGMQPIFQEGIAKVAQGITTLEEVLAVCDEASVG